MGLAIICREKEREEAIKKNLWYLYAEGNLYLISSSFLSRTWAAYQADFLFLVFGQPAGGSGPRLQIMLLFSFRLPERRAAANETKYVRKAAVRSVGKKGRTWKSDVG